MQRSRIRSGERHGEVAPTVRCEEVRAPSGRRQTSHKEYEWDRGGLANESTYIGDTKDKMAKRVARLQTDGSSSWSAALRSPSLSAKLQRICLLRFLHQTQCCVCVVGFLPGEGCFGSQSLTPGLSPA